jgi:hypothetical protein
MWGGGDGGTSPSHFLDVSAKIFHHMSGKFFAVLRFLSNLADNVEYSLILIHSRGCLLNLADNVEYSLILIYSKDCLSNLADNVEYSLILIYSKNCFSNLADNVEYSLILIYSKNFRFAREQQLYNYSLTKDHLSKIVLRFRNFFLREKLYPRQRSRLRRQNYRKNFINCM